MPKKQHKKTPATDYQALKKVWYKKLEKSGFEDAEENEFYLKQYSFRFSAESVRRSYIYNSEYYALAEQFLHNYKFEANIDKIIWEYHTNGISVRNIAKLLKRVKIMKFNKDNVSVIVKRLATEMKKMYLAGNK